MNLHNYLLYFILPVLSLSTIFVFIRFLKGPNIADRVISFDLMVTIGLGAIAVYSILSGQAILLDIAMVVALIGFLSTAAFSYYLGKGKTMIEGIVIILSGIGAIAILLASIGLLRMPDLYLRLSVTTKAATLGVGLILISAAFYFQNVGVTSRVLAIIFFTTVTAPVSAQLIGRAAYIIKTKMWKHTIIDELDGMYDSTTKTLHGMEAPDNEEAAVIEK